MWAHLNSQQCVVDVQTVWNRFGRTALLLLQICRNVSTIIAASFLLLCWLSGDQNHLWDIWVFTSGIMSTADPLLLTPSPFFLLCLLQRHIQPKAPLLRFTEFSVLSEETTKMSPVCRRAKPCSTWCTLNEIRTLFSCCIRDIKKNQWHQMSDKRRSVENDIIKLATLIRLKFQFKVPGFLATVQRWAWLMSRDSAAQNVLSKVNISLKFD